MIAFSLFLFVVLIVAWLLMPGGERQLAIDVEPAAVQPETQTA